MSPHCIRSRAGGHPARWLVEARSGDEFHRQLACDLHLDAVRKTAAAVGPVRVTELPDTPRPPQQLDMFGT